MNCTDNRLAVAIHCLCSHLRVCATLCKPQRHQSVTVHRVMQQTDNDAFYCTTTSTTNDYTLHRPSRLHQTHNYRRPCWPHSQQLQLILTLKAHALRPGNGSPMATNFCSCSWGSCYQIFNSIRLCCFCRIFDFGHN